MTSDPFFRSHVPDGWRIDEESGSVIRHEVLFEKDLNTVRGTPLFIGRLFGARRFAISGLIIALLLSALLGRAAWMQIFNTARYRQVAESNRLHHVPIWPRRGLILDRRGRLLTQNVSRFQLTLTPRELPAQGDDANLELGEVARILGITINDILSRTEGGEETVMVKDDVPYAQAMSLAIAEPHLPGFQLEAHPRRQYPESKDTQSLSHVLGYVGKLSPEEYETEKTSGYRRVDEIGKAGIERSYESVLRGTLGEHVNEVDAKGRIKMYLGDVRPKDGEDVRLSLDLDLQEAVERFLKDEMRAAQVKKGSAIVMDPRDGSILALVSLPAFDDNAFAGSVSSTVYKALTENPDEPLFPRAWAGTYPSGSTVKIVISTAALAEGVITPQTTVMSMGGIKIGPWFFPDWKTGGHGATNVRKAIAWSVNTFFYTIGGGHESFVGLGVDRLTHWMRQFGLGSKTGIDLPAEASGFVPSKQWKEETKGTRWFVGDTYNLSIGQGDLLVTPIQVANYTAAIANGGALLVPRVASATQSAGNRLPVKGDAIRVVQEGMRDAVTYGSARFLNDLPISVAGKTGTAQWNNTKRNHAWFTGFAPADHPEIIVTVMLEEGGEGSSTAVPVAKKIFYEWWRLKQQRGGTF